MSDKDKELEAKLKEKEKEIEKKDAVIEEQGVLIKVLRLRTKPRSLGFYRSRFQ